MAIIDFVSFSYTPEIIDEIIKKIGNRNTYLTQSVKLETQFVSTKETSMITITNDYGTFDVRDLSSSFSTIFMRQIRQHKSDFYDAALHFVKASTFDIQKGQTYEEVKEAILSFLGIDMLNKLCGGSIDLFINRFNHSLNSAGNQWTIKQNPKGKFGYDYSAQLLVNGLQGGIVAWGASNGGCYVSISGSGCAYIDLTEMYKMLNQTVGCQLTRVDLAVDFLKGEHNCNQAFKMWKNGQFKSSRGKAPKATWIMSGGECIDKKKVKYTGGRTLYIGKKENGKCIRIYEKGLQLKDSDNPNWVRWEVQIGNKGRDIPFDILLKPCVYFSGAYPCLSSLTKVEGCRVETKKRVYTQSVNKIVSNLSTASAKRLCFLRDGLGYKSDKILDLLIGNTTMLDLDDHMYVAALSKVGDISLVEAEELIMQYKKTENKYRYTDEIIRLISQQNEFYIKSQESACVPF